MRTDNGVTIKIGSTIKKGSICVCYREREKGEIGKN